jgi:serine/threonine protein phosphatase PrpC
MTDIVLRCSNPTCGEPVRQGDRFCEVCGQDLHPVVVGAVPTASAAKRDGESPSRSRRARDHVELGYKRVAGVSDRGLYRARNEDAIALARLDPHDTSVLVVCDGVSTSHRAHVAAQVAADTALAALVAAVERGQVDLEEAMRQAVVQAQEAVANIPYRAGAKDPPSSTLVAAIVKADCATVGWVGDSRAYLVCPTGTWQLSRDDTWVADQVAQGLLSEAEAAGDPNGHVLTRWLGEDWRDGQAASVLSFEVAESGYVVLCSDGLWNYLPTEEHLAEAVAEVEDATPLVLAAQLTELARQAGGHDNITVAVAAVDTAPGGGDGRC